MNPPPEPIRRCTIGAIETPIGILHYATDEADLLCAMCFHGVEVLERDVVAFHGRPVEWAHADSNRLAETMTDYFSGQVHAITSIPVRRCGSEFERAVWDSLRAIPPGQTGTYGGIAAKIGRSGAARAVGLANGRNPNAVVVPCHRVIGAGGTLVGYGAGLERKRWLLEHERDLRTHLL